MAVGEAGASTLKLSVELLGFLQRVFTRLFEKNPESGLYELTKVGRKVCWVLGDEDAAQAKAWSDRAEMVINNYAAMMIAFGGARAYIP